LEIYLNVTQNHALNSQNGIANPGLCCGKCSERKENCRSLIEVTHLYPPNPYILQNIELLFCYPPTVALSNNKKIKSSNFINQNNTLPRVIHTQCNLSYIPNFLFDISLLFFWHITLKRGMFPLSGSRAHARTHAHTHTHTHIFPPSQSKQQANIKC